MNHNIFLKEEWHAWNPDYISTENCVVTQIIQDIEGTKILLDNEYDFYKIFFEGVTPLVRSCEQGLRMRTWSNVQKKYNNKKYFNNYFLHKVEKSNLIDWIMEEDCGFYEREELQHFSIVTSVEIIDIVSYTEPEILKIK